MKIITTLIVSLLSFTYLVRAQGVPEGIPYVDGMVIFDKVYDAPEKNKSELFTLAKLWFVNEFKDAKEVIQYSDADEGKIIGKGYSPCSFGLGINIHLMITIMVKDEKYRAVVSDIYINVPRSQYYAGGQFYADWLFLPEYFYNKRGEPKPHYQNYYDCTISTVQGLLSALSELATDDNIPANSNW